MSPSKLNRGKAGNAFHLIVGLSLLYVTMPFFSGVLGYWDSRGPLVYPETFHRPFHRLGWQMANRHGKARIPSVERTFFYRLEGFKQETRN